MDARELYGAAAMEAENPVSLWADDPECLIAGGYLREGKAVGYKLCYCMIRRATEILGTGKGEGGK